VAYSLGGLSLVLIVVAVSSLNVALPTLVRELGGSAEAVGEWLNSFVQAGVEHLVIRIAGDHSRHLEQIARVRAQFDW